MNEKAFPDSHIGLGFVVDCFSLARGAKADAPSGTHMSQESMMGHSGGMMGMNSGMMNGMGMMQMMQRCVQHCTQEMKAVSHGKTGMGSGMMNGMGMMGSGMMSR